MRVQTADKMHKTPSPSHARAIMRLAQRGRTTVGLRQRCPRCNEAYPDAGTSISHLSISLDAPWPSHSRARPSVCSSTHSPRPWRLFLPDPVTSCVPASVYLRPTSASLSSPAPLAPARPLLRFAFIHTISPFQPACPGNPTVACPAEIQIRPDQAPRHAAQTERKGTAPQQHPKPKPFSQIKQGEWIPSDGLWPVDPQQPVQVSDDRIWVDGCFDFAHHGMLVTTLNPCSVAHLLNQDMPAQCCRPASWAMSFSWACTRMSLSSKTRVPL